MLRRLVTETGSASRQRPPRSSRLRPPRSPKTHQRFNYTRRQSSWASSSVFAQIPLRSTHGTYRGPTLVSVTASLAATAIRARRLGVLEPWWRIINRSLGSAPISRSLRALSKKGVREVAKQDIAPMGRKHIGLTLATSCRNDDLDLAHFMPSHGIGLAAPHPRDQHVHQPEHRRRQSRATYGAERPAAASAAIISPPLHGPQGEDRPGAQAAGTRTGPSGGACINGGSKIRQSINVLDLTRIAHVPPIGTLGDRLERVARGEPVHLPGPQRGKPQQGRSQQGGPCRGEPRRRGPERGKP